MKGDMTEERLISFLYGEVKPEERKEIEEYLRNNPTKQKELEELGNFRTTLRHWQDIEDIEKPNIFQVPQSRNEDYNLWKRLAIAASVALFMTLGWISYKDLVMPDNGNAQVIIAQEQLNKLLESQEKMARNNDKLINHIAELEKQINEISEDQKDQQSNITTDVVLAADSKDLVREYMTVMQQQNRQVMDEYFTSMNLQQQQYLESMLTDFGNYMNEQRRQDIQILQARIDNLEQNTGEFQDATAQLMANLTNSNVQQLENY